MISNHNVFSTITVQHSRTYLVTYLHSWFGPYKTGIVSETVEDNAKVTTTVPHVSITVKMYNIEWPLSEIQDHRFLKSAKMEKYSLVYDSDAM